MRSDGTVRASPNSFSPSSGAAPYSPAPAAVPQPTHSTKHLRMMQRTGAARSLSNRVAAKLHPLTAKFVAK